MTIIDDHSLLTQQQLDLLKQCAAVPFSLGTFVSIDNILTELKVDVIIEPGTITRSIPRELEEAQDYWNAKKKQADDYMEERNQAERNLDIISQNLEVWRTMRLRGLYDPKKNQIKLFPKEMQQEYGGKHMDELLVSTFAHETMHAYFNRSRHEKYPYVLFVEEPLAEFGMLCYLHETKSRYYDWAYTDVRKKRTCYRYGATLMDQYLQGDTTLHDYLKSYKIPLTNYIIPSWKNSVVSLPQSGASCPIILGGNIVFPQWQNLSYFYDKQSKTLGLNGDWRGMDDCYYQLMRYFHDKPQNIYLADEFRYDDLSDDFRCGDLADISKEINMIVSPNNKTYKQGSNGIPVLRKDNTPCIRQGLDGLYHICRNNKWGVVDEHLHVIIPFKYSHICYCDENDLFLVVNYDNNPHHGLVNKQGKEQVPLIYEEIKK